MLALHINDFVAFEITGENIKCRRIFVVDIVILFLECFFEMGVGEFVI